MFEKIKGEAQVLLQKQVMFLSRAWKLLISATFWPDRIGVCFHQSQTVLPLF